MDRDILRIMSKRKNCRHPDFFARYDDGCEARVSLTSIARANEFKTCKRKARVFVNIQALAGYPAVSAQLCRPHARRAELEWQAELVAGTSITELLSKADSGASFADIIAASLQPGEKT